MTEESRATPANRVRQNVEKLRDTEDEQKRIQRLRSKHLKPTKTSLAHFRRKHDK